MRYTLITIFCLTFTSCNNKKEEVIHNFNTLYTHIVSGNTEYIDDNITEESAEFIEKLTSLKEISVKTILDLGKEYRIQDFLFNYYALYKKELDTNNTSKSFYNYLALEGVPLFDLMEVYKVNKENSKVAPDIFIAIFKSQYGNNYLNWARLVEENSRVKFDLLYTLELFNKKHTKLHDIAFKDWNSGTRIEFYEELSKLSDYNGFDYALLKNLRARHVEHLNKSLKKTK